jgi:exonuclease VII small subunit
VKEREKVQRAGASNAKGGSAAPSSTDAAREARRRQREAEQALAKAEQEVARLEAQVAEVTRALDDPELYVTPAGVERATKLGVELENGRAQLDAALARWATATETLERLAGAARGGFITA